MNDRAMLTTRAAAEYLGVKERALAQNWFRWGLRPSRVAVPCSEVSANSMCPGPAWLVQRRLIAYSRVDPASDSPV